MTDTLRPPSLQVSVPNDAPAYSDGGNNAVSDGSMRSSSSTPTLRRKRFKMRRMRNVPSEKESDRDRLNVGHLSEYLQLPSIEITPSSDEDAPSTWSRCSTPSASPRRKRFLLRKWLRVREKKEQSSESSQSRSQPSQSVCSVCWCLLPPQQAETGPAGLTVQQTNPVLLARLLFACWVDICLSARRTCPVAAGTSLNLDPSLSPATVFSDRNICARKHSLQFVCRLLGLHTEERGDNPASGLTVQQTNPAPAQHVIHHPHRVEGLPAQRGGGKRGSQKRSFSPSIQVGTSEGQAKEVEETDMEASKVGRPNTPHTSGDLWPLEPPAVQTHTSRTCCFWPLGVAQGPRNLKPWSPESNSGTHQFSSSFPPYLEPSHSFF
ncbi:unnamed protein product [Tetraodon nigroviridis]|uniref:(spotted green pufferfish) hypothetical protein n=1 Tax=Tetraodon nigroviridis TaxID=99883 RepID=Q4S920_TETNG|nr:unnamed protein product [Tetraodon nigroviridis]